MKILTLNFLTCAVRACKTSPAAFPLRCKDAALEQQEIEYNEAFLRNVLPRVEWDALRKTATELGFTTLPATKPEYPNPDTNPGVSSTAITAETDELPDATDDPTSHTPSAPAPASASSKKTTADDSALWHELHTLLVETQIVEGTLVCGNCGHEYAIREGIANFLLPSHLV